MRKYHAKKLDKEALYPYQPWKITEQEFLINTNHHNEAIFSLGNGYMGLRGTLEEDYPGSEDTTTPGFYINGVYASEKIIYGEEAPNLPQKGQTIVNLADWSEINLYINEEKLNLLKGKIHDYKRELDLKQGLLRRKIIWEDRQGRKIEIKITRLISLSREHIGAIRYQFKAINFSGKISVNSALNGDVRNHHNLREKRALEVIESKTDTNTGHLLHKVKTSNFKVAYVVEHLLDEYSKDNCEISKRSSDNRIDWIFEISAVEGEEYTIDKIVGINHCKEEAENPLSAARASVARASITGFENLVEEQAEFMSGYWQDVDVKIEGAEALQQAFRFNAFHILQAAGKDGQTSVAAKGISGEHYEGHYFWDTESYILPFFAFQRPEVARNLLLYRYNTLDKAKKNADRMRLNGALYPWRTINGEEASGFFMGSTVQYHINADIAYAVNLYYQVSRDQEFMENYGLEILIETARMWLSLGSYIPMRDNKFCFNEVCGPDEYKPGVNNNAYTNYMAKFNLDIAIKMAEIIKDKSPEKYKRVAEKIDLTDNEIDRMREVAEDIYLPYNEELEITPQDDSFLYKNPIEVDNIPEAELPLVKNWHPLIIWRYQVIKQADVLLLMLQLGDQFSRDLKIRNYDYYEPKTTHDSSLSPAIYSILASEIGYKNQSYNYFMQTARLDLDDFNENVYQGVHTACMGGTWLALVQGFAGMRMFNNKLYFHPHLPDGWDKYQFRLRFKGSQIEVTVKENEAKYMLLAGEKVEFKHYDQLVVLEESNLCQELEI
ncbi:alpha,alpha-trehalose phosphorylase [Halanaerobium saccharolyticum]|uniref:Alpha,alpha-trehalose phosphorylase n=1 Tax=Halanaerobium saccharolyticum TaxID=43595 RepID=A0A4R6LFL6_9FIRM|nr:glycosyl hydrolase family 65 protein [Halanaerobium saccharolyticum]TDO78301.1 alpha,alpha-trehalose phosphorylase [Halanaerobium saccharolyticum]